MNKFEKRSISAYNKKADLYEDTPEGRYTLNINEMLLKNIVIPKGSRVLDIACGNGRFLSMLSRTYQFSGYGIDIAEKMVENAAKLNPFMKFEVARCDQLPFLDAAFDVITVNAAFHHFPHVQASVIETSRVLKSGGMFYITEIYYPGIFKTLFNLYLKFSQEGDVRIYKPDEITNLLSATGLSVTFLKIIGQIQIIGAQKINPQK
jgi:Methylase involved in ubiquinone/menaquinone biosynthesis